MEETSSVEITLKLYATLGDYLPRELNGKKRVYNQLPVDVPAQATVQSVIDRFKVPPGMAHLVLVNGTFVPRGERATRALNPGDELAVWPPIAGG
ncbi:MAG TPA: MoaD/ThiS family protein [Casimicrobiaceae bacterium]|nr:MoaD/ThiS family protein [Casimicrobiaceae bacterium]